MLTSESNRLFKINTCVLMLFLLIAFSYSYAQTTDSQNDNTDIESQNTDEVLSGNGQSENSDKASAVDDSQQDKSNNATNTQLQSSVFNIDTLIERMKQTSAIGVISKLSLKNKVDDLLEQAEELKAEQSNSDNSQQKLALREDFEGLILKTVALLNKGEDFTLAEDIYLAREELWKSIMENKA